MASLSVRTNASFARPSARPSVSSRRAVLVKAKYGEQSKYFDLKDMENTTGSWDMYGQDDKKRYPGLQETFFNQATEILSRREALRGFVALAGIGAIITFGAKGAKLADLPITKPPAKSETGKGGTIRNRI